MLKTKLMSKDLMHPFVEDAVDVTAALVHKQGKLGYSQIKKKFSIFAFEILFQKNS